MATHDTHDTHTDQFKVLDDLEHRVHRHVTARASVTLAEEHFDSLVAWARRGLEAEAGNTLELALPDDRRHCDGYIHDRRAPLCLRIWILAHRLPSVDCLLLREAGIRPELYADHEGRRVRVVMASRLGDVGVTSKLDAEYGYERRVLLDQLSNFGVVP